MDETFITVYHRFITLKNGRRLDAFSYGKKAFVLKVKVRKV
jgi:hypothetical protein